MAATKQKKDWTTIDDEEGENFEARTEKERITRIREINENNTKKKVEEVVEIHKRIFPVRKAVKERKKIKKFGEVKGVPPGEHLAGDWILGDIVGIDTLEHMEKNEIDIVNRIKSINTDAVKERKARERHEKLNRDEDEAPQKSENLPPAKVGGTGKLSSWIPAAGGEKTSIRITNIQPFEDNERDSEDNFTAFLEKVFEENIMKKNKNMNKMPHYTLKMPKNNGRLRGVAFMSFSDSEYTNKFYNVLDTVRPVYNNCVLEISWATQDTNRDKPKGDRGDRGGKPFRK